ncbi:MAG TPA: RNA polymerase sigma factor [Clostridia bacterium]|nr:RNA polymerase sigma factor [Clostridia bacterium]HPQ47639.1 RNA polymerase sigma factor [Clostridia bacterium]
MSASPDGDRLFTIKYDQYSNMIFKMTLMYLNNSMDCEDVMQEVFIRLLKKGDEFKDNEHEKRWVLRITINCCIDKIRKNEKQKALPLDEGILVTESEEEDHLAQLIVGLPESIKGPIHLHYYEGYKVHEISRILGIGTSAVKMRLKRGREMLKLLLGEE